MKSIDAQCSVKLAAAFSLATLSATAMADDILVLDHQRFTCSKLNDFVNQKGVVDLNGTRTPGNWGMTIANYIFNGRLYNEFLGMKYTGHDDVSLPAGFAEAIDLKDEVMPGFSEGTKKCIKATNIDVTLAIEGGMSRIEWDHEWPPESPCVKEWERIRQQIERHEKKHMANLRRAAEKFNRDFAQDQSFRVACAESVYHARDKLLNQIRRAIYRKLKAVDAIRDAQDKRVDREKAGMDCSKCKSYSFDGLSLEWKTELYNPLKKKYQYQGSSKRIVSGKICGDPRESDVGHVFLRSITTGTGGYDATQRNSWPNFRDFEGPAFRKMVFSPSDATQSSEDRLQGPTMAWSINLKEMEHEGMFRQSGVSSAKVPVTVSEEPAGCGY